MAILKKLFSQDQGKASRAELPEGKRKAGAVFSEIFISFLVLDCINFLFFRDDPGFLRAPLHPYWLVVLFAASRYGFVPGLTAGFLASVQILLVLFRGIPTKTEFEKILEVQGLVLPAAFFFAGVFLGELRQKYLNAEEDMRKALKEKSKLFDGMKKQLEMSEKVKEVLETRIVGQTATVKTLYETARKFEALSPEEICRGCLEMLNAHLHVQGASLYFLEGEYWVLKSAVGKTAEQVVEGKISREKSMMALVLREKRSLAVKDILNIPDSDRYIEEYNRVLAMIPVYSSEGAVAGVVNVEKMDFLNFHKANLQLIELVVDWTGKALQNVRFYRDAQRKQIFDEDYQIYHFQHFERVLRLEFLRAVKYRLPLSVLMGKINHYGIFEEPVQRILSRTIISLLKRDLDDTDMIFRYRYDGTFSAVCPMKSREALEEKLKRLLNEFEEATRGARSDGPRPDFVVAAEEIDFRMADYRDLLNPALTRCGLKTLAENHRASS
ncbi:MAG TPA: GAF domain-containing protein [Candidatus Omnitrophota bacterium]|mgnify:CR=1 FL=1|nr:GAF domain-containing protein [Candidatus Omnitrophota bacterium]